MGSLDRAHGVQEHVPESECDGGAFHGHELQLAQSKSSQSKKSTSTGVSSVSSSSLSSELSTAANVELEQETSLTKKQPAYRIIRKRPSLSDLQRHLSTPRLVNEQHSARSQRHHLTTPQRRSFSAHAALQAWTRLTSPDRYIPQRPSGGRASPNVHTSKSPDALRGRELYTRSRNTAVDPFRTISESRSANVVRRRIAGDTIGIRVLHYTPSFVNGTDAGVVEANPRAGTQTRRQPSWGGFWTVGGRGGAQFGQLHGVPTAAGGLLASGTSAPLHCPPFLDEPTRDDKTRAHESRLALALDIDQAARILNPTPLPSPPVGLRNSSQRPFPWNDGTWTTHQLPRGQIIDHPSAEGHADNRSALEDEHEEKQTSEDNAYSCLPSTGCTSSQRRLLLLGTGL